MGDEWEEIVKKFLSVPDVDVPRTKEGREYWRRIGRQGMHSALGEYTPRTEFEILLDYIDELETKLVALQAISPDVASPPEDSPWFTGKRQRG